MTEGPIDPTSTQSFPTVGPRDSGDKTEIQNTKIEMLKTKYKMKRLVEHVIRAAWPKHVVLEE